MASFSDSHPITSYPQIPLHPGRMFRISCRCVEVHVKLYWVFMLGSPQDPRCHQTFFCLWELTVTRIFYFLCALPPLGMIRICFLYSVSLPECLKSPALFSVVLPSSLSGLFQFLTEPVPLCSWIGYFPKLFIIVLWCSWSSTCHPHRAFCAPF